MMGFAGRLWARWRRWAGLSVSDPHSAAVLHAAYLRGARDALDSLALGERERLICVYRDSNGSERPDAVLAHKAVSAAIKRAQRQIDAMEESRRAGKPEESWCGGARRLANIRRELSYLAGEGWPEPVDLPWPPRLNPRDDGRLRLARGAASQRQATGQPTSSAGQPTGDPGDPLDDSELDPGREWYAHEGAQHPG